MVRVIAVMTLLSTLIIEGVEADAASDSLLARKFSPILILTEETGTAYDEKEPIRVLKPEPVEIVGAGSGSNIWLEVRDLDFRHIIEAPIDSTVFDSADIQRHLRQWYPNGRVDISGSKFAFLEHFDPRNYGSTGGGLTPGIYLTRAFFNYPGKTVKKWNDTYFGTGAHRGENYPNTAYVHIYKRTIATYQAQYDSVTVIQYNYFYPYNHWWNSHEGDWPRIDVVVSSSNPTTATILGVEYRFHKVWLSYYKDYGTDPGITDRFVFNPQEDIKLIGTHPVAYIGAGSHAAYPIGGHIEIFNPLEVRPGSEGASGASRALFGTKEYMSHTGLVLSTLADGSHSGLWESYDLVSLPDPDTSNTSNMGLPNNQSWLGARIRWGTPVVNSSLGSEVGDGNLAPDGPYNSNKDSWGNLKLFDEGSIKGDPFLYSDLELTSYHHWTIIGDQTWSDTVSLTGDVVIFPGTTLTIKPNTVVEFKPGKDRHKFTPEFPEAHKDDFTEIFVYGTLTAEGKSDSLITFQSGSTYQGNYAWAGIRKKDGATVNLNDHTRILDAPPLKVAFKKASYPIELSNGTGEVEQSVSVTVEVVRTPYLKTVTIPITVTALDAESGDYRVSGLTSGALNFAVAHGTQSFTVTGLPDSDFDNDRVTLGFGTLPDGVVAGEQATATVTILDHGTTPAAPDTLTTDPYTGNVTVKWDSLEATPAVTGYELEYQSRPGVGGTPPWEAWTALATPAAGDTSYTHRGLSYPTKYRYRLRATNARGAGAWSGALPPYGVAPYPVGLQAKVEQVYLNPNVGLEVVLDCPFSEPELCGHLAQLDLSALGRIDFQFDDGGGRSGDRGTSGAAQLTVVIPPLRPNA